MSSEAITRNDLTNILNEVLPPTASEYRKLLWTNPNPTTAFATQTISLDLSNYDAIEIVATMYLSNSVAYREAFSGKVGDAFVLSATIYGTTTDITRLCETNNTQVIINTGYVGTTQNNQAVIPYQIYGIKYERVSIPQEGVPSLHIVKKSLPATAQSGKDRWIIDISPDVPSGATVQAIIITRLPNPNWIYADVNSYSNTQVTIPYNNTYSSAITETLELGILYTL